MPQYKTLHPKISKKVKKLLFVLMFFCVINVSLPQIALAGSLVDPTETSFEELYTPYIEEGYLEETAYHLPENKDKEPKEVIRLLVTAYSSTTSQTSGNPYITASGSRVRDGIIAANFLPIGTKVRFPEYSLDKVYKVEDRMGARYWQRADIWFPTYDQAVQFGVKELRMEIL